MRTFPGLRLGVWTPEQRDQMKFVDDMMRMVSGGLSRSILTGQSPAANPVRSLSNPTGPPPAQGTPAAQEGDLLVGAINGSWIKLPAGGPGSALKISGNNPFWQEGSDQLGWTQEWRANGPYQVGTGVDGGIVVPTSTFLSVVWLYSGVDGSGGLTTVVLKKNGSSIGSFDIATGVGRISYVMSNNLVASDLITMDITVKQTGDPRDLSVIVKGI